MKHQIRILLSTFILLVCMGLKASAQVVVEQTVDSVAILIGDQAHLRLVVTMPDGARIQWPKQKAGQYIAPGMEIVETKEDTLSHDGGSIKVEKVYTITSFDEKLYSIPPMTVKVNGKSYKGVTAALKVITVNVDTLHPNKMLIPEDVQDNPFDWAEWRPYLWLSVLVMLLSVLVFWLVLRLKQNKPVITRIRIVKHLPAHQRALTAIEKIKEERLQTSEDQKTYYTQLTDTLRQYIEERFGFRAMEMTSSEIIDRLRENGDQKMIDELRELFQTADLVKFAKYSTLINENDLNLVNAIKFVDETKQNIEETEERIVPQLSDDDKRTRQNRATIKVLLWGLGIVILGTLAYIIYNVYLLTM